MGCGRVGHRRCLRRGCPKVGGSRGPGSSKFAVRRRGLDFQRSRTRAVRVGLGVIFRPLGGEIASPNSTFAAHSPPARRPLRRTGPASQSAPHRPDVPRCFSAIAGRFPHRPLNCTPPRPAKFPLPPPRPVQSHRACHARPRLSGHGSPTHRFA